MTEIINIPIESLIPHRDRMKLIDRIIFVHIDDDAETESVVSDTWPSLRKNEVNSVIGIELIAQTVAVSAGWKSYKKTGEGEKGWLIGIKNSSFAVDRIALGTTVRTYIKSINHRSNYGTFRGTVTADGKEIMSAEIQVFRPDDSVFD